MTERSLISRLRRRGAEYADQGSASVVVIPADHDALEAADRLEQAAARIAALEADVQRLARERDYLTEEYSNKITELAQERDDSINAELHAHERAAAAEAALAEALTRARTLEAALTDYLYETTHLSTPETVGGREYYKALIPKSATACARAVLAKAEATVVAHAIPIQILPDGSIAPITDAPMTKLKP